MKRYVIFISIILIYYLIGGCSNKNENIDLGVVADTLKPLIKKDKLVKLLADIHLSDAFLSNMKTVGIKLKKQNDYQKFYSGVYVSVFKKYNVSQPEFYKTLQYYSFHQDEFLNIYDKVIDLLNAEEDSILNKRIRKK